MNKLLKHQNKHFASNKPLIGTAGTGNGRKKSRMFDQRFALEPQQLFPLTVDSYKSGSHNR